MKARMLASRPKKIFCGIHRFTLGACDAISQFNDGSHGRYNLFKSLKVVIGDNLRRGLQREQKTRLRLAAKKVSDKYKRRRQDLRQQRKSKKKKDLSYQAGSFSSSANPAQLHVSKKPLKAKHAKQNVIKHLNQSKPKKIPISKKAAKSFKSKRDTKLNCEIKFVPDSDVQMIKIFNFS